MAGDEWRMARVIPTVDTGGRRTEIRLGMVEREDGLEPALRVGKGPTVLLPFESVGPKLLTATQRTLEAWWRMQGGR